MQLEHDRLRRKNDDTLLAYHQKCKRQLQTQELYDKLKRRSMVGQVQNAASDAVDNTISSANSCQNFLEGASRQNYVPQQIPSLSDPQSRSIGQNYGNDDSVSKQLGGHGNKTWLMQGGGQNIILREHPDYASVSG